MAWAAPGVTTRIPGRGATCRRTSTASRSPQTPTGPASGPAQPEILTYFEGLVERFDLGPHLRFDTEVTEVSWSDDDRRWTTPHHRRRHHRRRAWCQRPGAAQLAPHPGHPGAGELLGARFHSARWDHSHDLTGERVGVIGIGRLAIQFVPPVARDGRSTTLFQRSANYVAPKTDRRVPTVGAVGCSATFPGASEAYRAWIYSRLEARFSIMTTELPPGRASSSERFAATAWRRWCPRTCRAEALIPDYRARVQADPDRRRLVPDAAARRRGGGDDGVVRVTPDGVGPPRTGATSSSTR